MDRQREYHGAAQTSVEHDAILDAIPDHLALLDTDGHIVYVNERWRRFAQENGGDPGSYVGQSYLAAATGDETADAVRDGIRDVLSGRKARFSLEYPCHSPSQERWFILAVTRVMAGEVRAVTTHTDITARVIGERQRLQATRDAEEKERLRRDAGLRRQLLNIVGHQISTPLTPMRLHIASLRKEAPEDHRLQAIDRNIERLERLRQGVARALEISALNGLDPRQTAWGPFWRSTAKAVAQELDMEDRVRIDASGDAEVGLDERWCRRMLHELLENASRFAPDGPVDVIARLGRRAELRVEDKGPGLSEEEAKGIFEAFADAGAMYTAAGAGVGLFIVQRVARLHGGQVRHEAGSPGSRWVVSLPRPRKRRTAPGEARGQRGLLRPGATA